MPLLAVYLQAIRTFNLAFLGLILFVELAAGQQVERRTQIGVPSLVRLSDRPLSRINVMRKHGNRLYVAGLDHCVYSYELDGDSNIDWNTVKKYRWPSWREERGEILAMDINDDGSRLAIGGYGLRTGVVAEFDVATQRLLRAKEVVVGTVSAIDYSSNGSLVVGAGDGSVALWKPTDEVVLWAKGVANSPMVVAVLADDFAGVVIHSDGRLLRYNEDGSSELLASFTVPDGYILAAEFSKDGERLLMGRRRDDRRSEVIEYGIAAKKNLIVWKSPDVWFVDGVQYTSDESRFFAFGLSDSDVTPTGVEHQSIVWRGVGTSGVVPFESIDKHRVSAIAPTISGAFLYVALDSSELWLRKAGKSYKQSEKEIGPATDLCWSLDQRSFMFAIGGKKWTFQFDRMNVTPGSLYTNEIYRHKEKIRLLNDRESDSWLSVLTTDGRYHPVKLKYSSDGEATSHITFEKEGKTLVAVGHCFGVSLFEHIGQGELKFIRKLIGHQGMVTSLAISEDRRLLLTGSSDGTICCFSLEPWKFHPELGAKFALKGEEIVVESVDDGSPIWETGLSAGDRIQRVQLQGQDLPLSKALGELQNPKVGQQFKFVSADLNAVVSTRTLQRPIWKFVHDGSNWILYRWRDYYYDCSTEGDQLVEWVVNPSDVSEPMFIRAEQARERFYQPAKLKNLLSVDSLKSKRIQVPELVPPIVQLTVDEKETELVIEASLTAEQNALLVGEPQELSIWVGDLRVLQKKSPPIPTTETITVPRSFLRNGSNRVIARAYNKFGVRGDSDSKMVEHRSDDNQPQLWGLAVGIQDYGQARRESSNSRDGFVVKDLTWTLNDALGIENALNKHTTPFEKSDVSRLTDHDVTGLRLAEEFQRIRGQCKPDDLFVLSFAGHGFHLEKEEAEERRSIYLLLTGASKLVSMDEALSSSIPVANPVSMPEAAVDFRSLFDALSTLPCRKLVLMDSCHSGGAIELVRALTPDFVVGPTVLTAASKNQFAIEVPSKMHGIFTAALLEAVGSRFDLADENHDNLISIGELHSYCATRVPQIFANSKRFITPEQFSLGQNPEFWAPVGDEQRPLFGKEVKP